MGGELVNKNKNLHAKVDKYEEVLWYYVWSAQGLAAASFTCLAQKWILMYWSQCSPNELGQPPLISTAATRALCLLNVFRRPCLTVMMGDWQPWLKEKNAEYCASSMLPGLICSLNIIRRDRSEHVKRQYFIVSCVRIYITPETPGVVVKQDGGQFQRPARVNIPCVWLFSSPVTSKAECWLPLETESGLSAVPCQSCDLTHSPEQLRCHLIHSSLATEIVDAAPDGTGVKTMIQYWIEIM